MVKVHIVNFEGACGNLCSIRREKANGDEDATDRE